MATKQIKEITVTIQHHAEGTHGQVAGSFYCPDVDTNGKAVVTFEAAEYAELFALAKEKLKAKLAEGGHEVTE